ncbi:HAD family phosphatase [Aurantimonas sp. MSK8Z-1]|uniref:HAD family hydrolase n=1 Tax=Mangrovibrevibacter kandeliae TaxID=2968473 RepID=UPI002118E370|nr:HAD family phosphatase [Aurantimonas sp. MSK8Z-1]MCW4113527.1 HAD family phosphatase [Aurantimonas sp. MSK8Z-1]
MSSLALAIFDCDGTLIDSEIIAAEVHAENFREFGLEIDAGEIAGRFAGLTGARMLELLAEENEIRFPDDFLKRANEEIDLRLGRDVKAIAGADDVLDRLDLARCICSNSSSERLRISLTHVGLWDRFRPYVFAAKEVGTRREKPAPDVFLYACKEFEVTPEQAVVLEDSVHGVAAAAAAGCRVVGFTGGRHSYPGHSDSLSDAGAETVIARLSDFPAVAEALGGWERA